MALALSNRNGNSGQLPGSRGWRYPRPVRRFAEQLLGQQLWCWGQDIKSPQGNLLMEFGFQRHRLRTADSQGSTCYRFDDDQRHIALWGFGLFYGERRLGGLYLGRFDFRPSWANLESLALGIHWPNDLPTFSLPRTGQQWQRAHQLCRRMLGWIALYEQWIGRRMGLAYREECVAKWLHPFIAARQIPSAWKLLQDRSWEAGLSNWCAVARRLRVR